MDDGKKRVFCCHALATEEDTWYGVRNEDMTRTLGELKDLHTPGDMEGPDLRRLVPHTMKLFEQSPGDAVEFFSQRFKWSEKDKRLVNKIDPCLRLACRKCKQVSCFSHELVVNTDDKRMWKCRITDHTFLAVRTTT